MQRTGTEFSDLHQDVINVIIKHCPYVKGLSNLRATCKNYRDTIEQTPAAKLAYKANNLYFYSSLEEFFATVPDNMTNYIIPGIVASIVAYHSNWNWVVSSSIYVGEFLISNNHHMLTVMAGGIGTGLAVFNTLAASSGIAFATTKFGLFKCKELVASNVKELNDIYTTLSKPYQG